MHCFVMGLLKQLAICVVPFLALHKNPRIKADSDLISASLTHGPRVVAADAAGAEVLVGVLKIIKGASYNKTREPT